MLLIYSIFLIAALLCFVPGAWGFVAIDSGDPNLPDVTYRGNEMLRGVEKEVSIAMAGFRHLEAARYDEAESCFKIALQAGRQAVNSYLEGLAWLGFGRLAIARAKYAEALTALGNATDMLTDKTDAQRRLTARADALKAEVMLALDRPGDARTQLDEAFRLLRGDGNTAALADVMYHSARYDYYLGHYRESAYLYRKAAAILKKLSGGLRPAMADIYLGLGKLYELSAEYDFARDHYDKAAEIFESSLGKAHPRTARAYAALGELAALTGDFPGGLVFLQKAMDIQELVLGRQHPDHAETSAALGILYLAADRFDNARNALQHSLDADTACFGAKSLPVARDYAGLGEVYRERMTMSLAIEAQRKALAIQTAILGDNHPALADTMNGLAVSLYYNGEYDKALKMQREALKLDLANISPNETDTDAQIADFNNIGILTERTGNPRDAIAHYLQAIAIEKQRTDANPLRLAALNHNLAELYSTLGEDAKAAEAYTESIKLMRWSMGFQGEFIAHEYTAPLDNRIIADKYVAVEGNQYLADDYLALADCQLRLGNNDEAEKAYKSFLRLTFPKDPRADIAIEVLKAMERWYDPEPSPKNFLPLSKPQN